MAIGSSILAGESHGQRSQAGYNPFGSQRIGYNWSDIHWIIKKTKEFQKNILFCFIYYAKAFDCVDHNKLWNILKEMVIPDHLTCLLRNLYAGHETTVRTGYGTMDWFQIGKEVCKGCILSPCLTYMQSTSWEMLGWMKYKAQAGIKIARRNINNLRYAMTPHLWQKVKRN